MFGDHVVEPAFSHLLIGDESSLWSSRALIMELSSYEQRSLLYSIIRVLSKKQPKYDKKVLEGSAALLSGLVGDDSPLQEQLASWLVGTSPEAIGHGNFMQRTVILAFSTHMGLFSIIF